ncbi:MAG: L-seryl-tRNA(Sec) selenium transferase [Armatimonadaceae bacterium]
MSSTPGNSAFRALPSVERLASDPALSHLSHSAAVRAARRTIDEAREKLRRSQSNNGSGEIAPDVADLAQRAATLAAVAEIPSLRRAINATGVVLHTNLGRATLNPAVAEHVAAVAAGHTSLEVDPETGGRGSRQTHCAELLTELTGAEDAFVVNNNAAATFLAVAALAAGREVVLSRGQLVEIGGQFRLPDVIEAAGAKLVEVGTTNRTRLADYEKAIGENTAMLLRVHPSNYRIVGFTEDVPIGELVQLGQKHGIPVADDIGSGALLDFSPYGLTDEPMAQRSILDGADIIWFSGDKLLGGPQAGILIGKKQHISVMKKHPLARALRPDKLTLAALEGTLRLYRDGNAETAIPILRRIARSAEDVLAACGRVARALRNTHPAWTVDIVASESAVGGGSLPGHTLPSWAVAIEAENINDLVRALRHAPVPVYGRMEKGRFLLDLRTVDESEEPVLAQSFTQVS